MYKHNFQSKQNPCGSWWLEFGSAWLWSRDPRESPAKFQIISVYTKITTADFKTEILITNKWMGKQSGFWQYTSFTIIQW